MEQKKKSSKQRSEEKHMKNLARAQKRTRKRMSNEGGAGIMLEPERLTSKSQIDTPPTKVVEKEGVNESKNIKDQTLIDSIKDAIKWPEDSQIDNSVKLGKEISTKKLTKKNIRKEYHSDGSSIEDVEEWEVIEKLENEVQGLKLVENKKIKMVLFFCNFLCSKFIHREYFL